MSLALNETGNYANVYFTNWAYLNNMTKLQMKPLKEMEWNRAFEFIHDNLDSVAITYVYENIEYSMKQFINDLNNAVKRLWNVVMV